jgi:hypothetical protein
MALVPMKQSITVKKPGSVDEWGNPISGSITTYKCRVDEGSELVVKHSGGQTSSETVVAEARIMIDGLADVDYADTVEFTNELNHTISRSPKQIDVKRNIGGDPILTVIHI